MSKLVLIVAALLLISCDDTIFFIVRHAEKATESMHNDPALTTEGEKQAQDLMETLKTAGIKNIFSTNYKRTLATAEPLRNVTGAKVEIYDPRNMKQFVEQLKNIRNGNVLVVSHSNVVDDVVNGLLGEKKLNDLPEDEYAVIYQVTRKGEKYFLQRIPFSGTTPR